MASRHYLSSDSQAGDHFIAWHPSRAWADFGKHGPYRVAGCGGNGALYVGTQVCMYVYVYLCICVHVYMCVCLCVCVLHW